MFNKEPTHICTKCGYQGRPVTKTKGSLFLELILWLMFLLPGVLYSIWRLTTRAKVCPKCKTPNMIPFDTPKGWEMLKEEIAKEILQ